MLTPRIAFWFLLCGLCAVAAPRVRVEPESLDFGAIKAGEKAEKTVTVYNDGDAPLIVLRGKATCGCTSIDVPEGEDASIAPGGSAQMPVWFDATGRAGKQSAVAAITTNDPGRPAVTVNVSALVETLTMLRPPNGLLWQQAARGGEIRRTVVIVPGDATKEIELIDVKSDQPALTPTAANVTRNGQHMIDVKFALAKDAPLGALDATVTARVRVAGEETTVTIPARGMVVGDVLVSPMEIDASRAAIKRGERIGEILVRAGRGGRAPDIGGLETAGPVRAELEPVRGEDLRKIVVSAALDAPAGPCGATVIIMTSGTDQPIVDVPVYFEVARDVSVQPESVVLDATRALQRIELRNSKGALMEVKGLTFDAKIVRASIVTAKQTSADDAAVVEVSPSDSKLESPRGTVLVVETDVPGETSIRVPVLVRP